MCGSSNLSGDCVAALAETIRMPVEIRKQERRRHTRCLRNAGAITTPHEIYHAHTSSEVSHSHLDDAYTMCVKPRRFQQEQQLALCTHVCLWRRVRGCSFAFFRRKAATVSVREAGNPPVHVTQSGFRIPVEIYQGGKHGVWLVTMLRPFERYIYFFLHTAAMLCPAESCLYVDMQISRCE